MIGWAEESLLPNKKVNILARFYERISDHVETPVTAAAQGISKPGQVTMCRLTCIVGLYYMHMVMCRHYIISYGDNRELMQNLCDILGIRII